MVIPSKFNKEHLVSKYYRERMSSSSETSLSLPLPSDVEALLRRRLLVEGILIEQGKQKILKRQQQQKRQELILFETIRQQGILSGIDPLVTIDDTTNATENCLLAPSTAADKLHNNKGTAEDPSMFTVAAKLEYLKNCNCTPPSLYGTATAPCATLPGSVLSLSSASATLTSTLFGKQPPRSIFNNNDTAATLLEGKMSLAERNLFSLQNYYSSANASGVSTGLDAATTNGATTTTLTAATAAAALSVAASSPIIFPTPGNTANSTARVTQEKIEPKAKTATAGSCLGGLYNNRATAISLTPSATVAAAHPLAAAATADRTITQSSLAQQPVVPAAVITTTARRRRCVGEEHHSTYATATNGDNDVLTSSQAMKRFKLTRIEQNKAVELLGRFKLTTTEKNKAAATLLGLMAAETSNSHSHRNNTTSAVALNNERGCGSNVTAIQQLSIKQQQQEQQSVVGDGGPLLPSLLTPTPQQQRNQSKQHQRFKKHQCKKWTVKYQELLQFKAEHGHCNVPHGYKENIGLAMWVKRQRHQYILLVEKKKESSTLTSERIRLLEKIGFDWRCLNSAWENNYKELCRYSLLNGHCHVPSTYKKNTKLASWVILQRRQCKLLEEGKSSTMTLARLMKLDKVGFSSVKRWMIEKMKNC